MGFRANNRTPASAPHLSHGGVAQVTPALIQLQCLWPWDRDTGRTAAPAPPTFGHREANRPEWGLKNYPGNPVPYGVPLVPRGGESPVS